MAKTTTPAATFAAVLAEVAAEATPARPRNAQRTADRREVADTRTGAQRARVAAQAAREETAQAAAEGRTQGTETGTSRTGRNGKVPCACQQATDAETGKPLVAQCGKDTWRTFAPGHDARLKGALIRAGLAGRKVRIGSDATEYDATTAAGAWGFRELVAHGVANPGSKLAKRAARAAKAQAEDPQPAPRTLVAKVGRWEREGELVTLGDGQTAFRYTTKGGKVVETTKFAPVAK